MSAALLAIAEEPSELKTVSAYLEKAGITVTAARGLLDAALQQIHSPVNLILCDADDVEWRTALAAFRQLPGKAQVIFLTRCADERLWMDMLDAGACDLLRKPYQPDELRWVVSTALRRTQPPSGLVH
jgi:DNA-binding response OmpR family regulator